MRPRLFGIATGMYTLSLLLPALATFDKPLFGGGGRDSVMFGMHCLAMGFFVWPGWVANPLVFLAWLLMALAHGRTGYLATARALAIVAIISAVLAPFLLPTTGLFQLRYPHVGYFVWLGSIVLTAVAAHLATRDAERVPS